MSSIIYNLYKNLEGYYLSYFKVDYLVKEICYILDNFYFYEENEKSNYSGYFNKNYRINYNIKVYNIKKNYVIFITFK